MGDKKDKLSKMIKKIREAPTSLRHKLDSTINSVVALTGMRPDSFPYLSGDGFRQIADWVYDETGTCRPSEIKEGQLVFLKADKVEEWFGNIHPKINYRYTLISHNSDYNITEADLNFIDDKIIHWYAQNVKVVHPQLTPIPIGINNLYLNYTERSSLFRKLNRIIPVRKNRIIFAFSISTNPTERQPAHDVLTSLPVADNTEWIRDRYRYLRTVRNYKFIAAPDGNGNDDPRRWQAMYVGVVPIVTRTASMEYFKSLGLPLYIIDDWRELARLEEKDLERIYDELKDGFGRAELYADFWVDKIKQNDK
ncbi:MAG: hypothetical protein COV08_01680 [Candidatus Vogelbacteria bacterium CG10_big_fil_rev_8_21_14_0_10_49_38]|uniref:Exostosin GT47 domain-containing protein n=1 Tax=Candidatus Vogelbacteria bacterium CG10_big_fil_rev_8_21_14_0_10_49_38 TaxID=1975043 RepID=A0A2H0RHY9_9BACT|nr:MAG: hypothetical protein BK006_01695 [bacterium CG10_49_38]PIR46108.1 MAG: hypothetical protein COV08_01680 [Candidatus Vogelbacteria bacterium CG10_big_fil_rev_8_21_14_0_10_49_38]